MKLKKEGRIARIISFLFHPLLMPTIGIMIIFNTGYFAYLSWELKRLVTLITFTGTFLFPVSIVPLFVYFKWVQQLEMMTYRERIIPLLFTSIMYYLTFVVLRKIPVPGIVYSFTLACAVGVFLNLLISFRWKISSHLIGIGGTTGLVLMLSITEGAGITLYLVSSILVSGLIAHARLKLNAHTPLQVYAGFLLGFMVTSLIVFFK
jgi:membrane-associated phospholipid phosphatase